MIKATDISQFDDDALDALLKDYLGLERPPRGTKKQILDLLFAFDPQNKK